MVETRQLDERKSGPRIKAIKRNKNVIGIAEWLGGWPNMNVKKDFGLSKIEHFCKFRMGFRFGCPHFITPIDSSSVLGPIEIGVSLW
jgi:hypothetical protein